MLVLAVFLSIGAAAVFFLLRFFFALESELRSARRDSTARVETNSAGRFRSATRVRDSAPAITLVNSRSRLALRPRQVSPVVHFQHEQNSQLKEA